MSYWNFAGVPFSYAYPALYMATHDPATYRYPTWFIASLFVLLTAAYVVCVTFSLLSIEKLTNSPSFDQAMGQKSRFKAQQTNSFIKRNAFPQLPGTTLVNPKFIVTSRGGKLLISGWWGFLRKPSQSISFFEATFY